MIELKRRLNFGGTRTCMEVSFPEVSREAVLSIDFQRTLRIPDDGRDYPLPPGLGTFPLEHIDDHLERVPQGLLERGGVLLPMYQSEALWLSFCGKHIPERQSEYPFAVKVATGKINAVTGEGWKKGMSREPQDYLVVPIQPWLDGYCVEKGIIRQFVAMPLGEGYTVEEQLTGAADVGGIQIEVFPMKREVFERRFPHKPARQREYQIHCMMVEGMGLAPGGRMRQEIYEDPYLAEDWDTEHGSRCFVHLVNSVTWKEITGENPPSKPFSAKDYTKHGLPWFEFYDTDARALAGGKHFEGIKSVGALAKEKRKVLEDNESIRVRNIVNLRAKLGKDQVREAASI